MAANLPPPPRKPLGAPPTLAETKGNLHRGNSPDRLTQLNVRIDAELHHQIKMSALEDRILVSDLVTRLFMEYLAQRRATGG